MRMTKKRWAATLVTSAALLFGLVGGAVLWHSMPENHTPPEVLQPEQPAASVAACPMWQPDSQGGRLWGYLDTQGQWVVEAQYQQALPFYQGAAVTWVQQGEQWLAIDRQGKTTVPKQNGQLDNSNQDGYVVLTDQGVSSLYDSNGVKVFGIEGRIGAFQGNLAPFTRQKNGSEFYGLLDRKGNIVIEPVYAAIGVLDQATVIAKTVEGQVLTLDLSGEAIAALPANTVISGAGGGFACYQDEQGFFGYVNAAGAIAVKAQYYQTGTFQQGAALVKTKEGFRLIDSNGNFLTQPFAAGVDLGKGLFAMQSREEGTYAIYNAAGQAVTANDVCQWTQWENGLIGIENIEKSYLMDASGQIMAGSEIEGSYRLYRRGGLFYGENLTSFYYDAQGNVLYRQAPVQQLELAGWQVTSALFAPDWYVQMAYPIFGAEGFVTEGLNAMVQEWCVEDYYENNEPDAENRYPSTLRGSYQLTTVNTLANILYTTEIQDNQSGQSKTILSSCLVDMVGGQRYRLEDLFYRGWKQTLRQQVEQIYRSQLPAGQEVPAALEEVFTDANWPQRNVPFQLTKEGVILYLQQNSQFTPVTVPYAALEKSLNTDSPLWQVIASGSQQLSPEPEAE